MCSVCGLSNGFESILDTPNIPIIQGCVSGAVKQFSYVQRWGRCLSCKIIQLTEIVDPSIIYSTAHAESFGSLWDLHHSKFTDFIGSQINRKVIEVGGGTGKLFGHFIQKYSCSKWHNYEVSSCKQSFADHEDYLYKQEELDLSNQQSEDVLVISHCLEHFLDLNIFFKKLEISKINAVYISWPNLEAWLIQGRAGALNWEHTFYLPLALLKKYFSNAGFNCTRSWDFEDHSVFLQFDRSELPTSYVDLVDTENSVSLVRSYFLKLGQMASKINDLVSEGDNNYIMPASAYTQYLFSFGLDREKFKYILDNSENKNHLYLYGTGLRVISPSEITTTNSIVVINAPGHYEEIKRKLVTNHCVKKILNGQS